jgi:hypothetical protein
MRFLTKRPDVASVFQPAAFIPSKYLCFCATICHELTVNVLDIIESAEETKSTVTKLMETLCKQLPGNLASWRTFLANAPSTDDSAGINVVYCIIAV